MSSSVIVSAVKFSDDACKLYHHTYHRCRLFHDEENKEEQENEQEVDMESERDKHRDNDIEIDIEIMTRACVISTQRTIQDFKPSG